MANANDQSSITHPSTLHVQADAVIVAVTDFVQAESKERICGLRVSYVGGNAYVRVDPSNIKAYGIGQLVRIRGSLIDGDKGGFRLGEKFDIVRTGGPKL